ncbi:MAG: PEP-CTERM sorting domain-containing protein [Verrucomicrobiota bacterium]
MKRYNIVLILCVCATVAQGGVIVSAPSSGWADGDRELGTGSDYALSGDTALLDWGEPETADSLLLDYDPSRPERAICAIDGQETGLLDLISPFLDISISNTMFTLEGFVACIDDFAAGCGETAEPQYIHINNSDEPLSDMDFVLEGTFYIDWTGAVSSRGEMGMRVEITQIPEPASILLVAMVSGLGLFIRRKFGS